MAYSKYGWSKAAGPTPAVPLVAPVDPEHLTPTADPDLATGSQLWVASTPAPTLPDSLTAEPFGTPVGGGGPIDRTPQDPNFGVGSGPALTTLESQDVRGAVMSKDLGAVAARQYQPMIVRDGSRHVAIIGDTVSDGASPQTLQYKQTGVGQPIDPYARLGKRIKRWMDRYIDFHRYDPAYRPMYQVYASTKAEQPAVAGGNQLVSPFAAFTPYTTTPDSFVGPQERVTPVPWDQPLTSDGIGAGGNQFGLTSWGL